ncbi:hypothetical protein M8756_17595 [Lutimaribacter sp. EGI FJ00015]|uniref:Uncharacterized protein n=1 Tax=Lutimaribacter degradans TaxID=2945989 RepID=A0ACC6A0N3_9RHOB|nr:hypothetical protein [Lutimaribacter sp. EGI FJ00013]MCM2563911.1 hypothetical protein [Lutimaribacter sp. EGI FJ00013]MCO0615126.1 hypothetical protein [Lutimaribacter sp. EGI FJ00015]
MARLAGYASEAIDFDALAVHLQPLGEVMAKSDKTIASFNVNAPTLSDGLGKRTRVPPWRVEIYSLVGAPMYPFWWSRILAAAQEGLHDHHFEPAVFHDARANHRLWRHAILRSRHVAPSDTIKQAVGL